jgi:hypothetical protein
LRVDGRVIMLAEGPGVSPSVLPSESPEGTDETDSGGVRSGVGLGGLCWGLGTAIERRAHRGNGIRHPSRHPDTLGLRGRLANVDASVGTDGSLATWAWRFGSLIGCLLRGSMAGKVVVRAIDPMTAP